MLYFYSISMNNNNKNLSSTNPYYHDEVTYDSKKENWSGVMSLMFIPIFILLVAWGVATTFRLPIRDDVGGNGQNNLQIGVGGGPQKNISPTPYKVPSITITPNQLLPTTDGLYPIQ